MNRRQFFTLLGVPALALPAVKLLGLPKRKDTFGIFGNDVETPWLQSSPPTFGTLEIQCHCGHSLRLPYIKGKKDQISNLEIPLGCGHRWKGAVIIYGTDNSLRGEAAVLKGWHVLCT